MSLWQLTRIALRSIRSNGTRSLLTMLGIIIGVAAVISTVSIGEGAQADIAARVQQLGSNLITVKGAKVTVQGVTTSGNKITITEGDVTALGGLPGVVSVVPETNTDLHVKAGRFNTGTTIVGTTPEYATVGNYGLAAGRFITAADEANSNSVAVLGQGPLKKLFPSGSPIDGRITINGLSFTVVGVLGPKGVVGQNDLDDQIVVPLSIYQRLLNGGTRNVQRATVQVASTGRMAPAMAEIDALLRQRHHIGAQGQPDFKVENQLSVLNTASSVTTTFTYLIGGLAAVSLLVGGIGIMNIMLVAVAERTHEIGIRKAIGAPNGALLGQFLLEAALLSVAGGLLGIALGIGASDVITRVAGWHTVVSPSAIAWAVSVSVAVGIFFGFYPASRAAGLPPVEALRHA